MPYITQKEREELDLFLDSPETPGQLAYLYQKLAMRYLAKTGRSYANYAAVIGVFATVQAEIYRRLVGPHEDAAIKKNGDVEW